MTTELLLKKLRLEGPEFITSDLLKKYCKSFKLDYDAVIKYFISRRYLLRIFRGYFYVRTLDELKLGREKYSHLELVAKGLELKSIKNWYFGLYTALKLNNLTHEHFTLDYVISDRMFRAKPITISGHKFRFLKLKPDLLKFGVINGTIRYSDPEKTMLDFIYLSRYGGVPEEKIIMDVSDYANKISKKKLVEYAKKYPGPVRNIAEKVAL